MSRPLYRSILERLDRFGRHVETTVLVLLLSGMIFLGTSQILLRNVFETSWIWADSVLVGADEGEVLWKVGVHRETNWSRPANDVIAGVTKKLAKKFPYRG